MSVISLSVKHNRTLPEARAQLEAAVREFQARYGALVQDVQWSPGRDAVTLRGPGFRVDIRVDAEHVHAAGDIPLLGQLFGPSVREGLKQIVEQKFPKRLT
ncbi:MAG TPA: polyhydroxyalkanoic acid system family protein [Gemmataceae bacterium]|nr:polyhydroxyalkanoic acid system family protein [Gemmataceae bacterium]